MVLSLREENGYEITEPVHGHVRNSRQVKPRQRILQRKTIKWQQGLRTGDAVEAGEIVEAGKKYENKTCHGTSGTSPHILTF
jgi:hypothetical protein